MVDGPIPLVLGIGIQLILWWWAYTFLAERAERNGRDISIAWTVGLIYVAGFLAAFIPFVHLYRRAIRPRDTCRGSGQWDEGQGLRGWGVVKDVAALFFAAYILSQFLGLFFGLSAENQVLYLGTPWVALTALLLLLDLWHPVALRQHEGGK